MMSPSESSYHSISKCGNRIKCMQPWYCKRPMTEDQISSFVRIDDHPTHGKTLVAVQAMSAGRTILTDPPIIIAPDNPWDWPAAFVAAPSRNRERILSLFSPVAGPNASRIRDILPTVEDVSRDPLKWSYLSHEGEMLQWDADLYLKVIMAFHFNGIGR